MQKQRLDGIATGQLQNLAWLGVTQSACLTLNLIPCHVGRMEPHHRNYTRGGRCGGNGSNNWRGGNHSGFFFFPSFLPPPFPPFWQSHGIRHTVDPFALVAAKHVDRLADICRRADTLQRAHVGQALVDGLHGHTLVAVGNVVPCILVEHVRLDATGGDGVDGHALLAAVDGEGAGEALDGRLGAGVEGVVGDAADAGGDGRGHDEAAALSAVLERVLGDKELAAAVEVEDLVEELRGDVDLGAPDLHTGVGDDKVDVAKVLQGLLEQLGDGLGLADVGLDRYTLGAQLAELSNHLLGGLGRAAIVDHHVRASLAQLQSNTLADATACTCDQGYLADEGAGRVEGLGRRGTVDC